MTEDEEAIDDAEEEGVVEKKGGKKKLIIIIVAVLLLLIGGGGAGAYFMGMFDSKTTVAKGDKNTAPPEPKIVYQYYDMKEMLINLQADAGQVRYLKLQVSVEYEEGINVLVIINAKTQIEDLFQTYLRELSPKDLEGSMGIFRLREELLKRINLIIAPERINGILFKKIVVQ